jgi:hypothetical protein
VQHLFIRLLILIIPPSIYVAIVAIVEVKISAAALVSLLFLVFAYVMLAVRFVLVPAGRNSAVLGMPLGLVAWIYLAIEFVLATLFIYVPRVPLTLAIVSQLILAGLFLVVYLTTMSSNIEISRNLDAQRSGVLIVRSAIARLDSLEREVADPQLVKSIAGLSEEFRYSPTQRPAEVRSQDTDIAIALDLLEEYVRDAADSELIVAQIAATSGALAARNSMVRRLQ